jgi:hypothetical protein
MHPLASGLTVDRLSLLFLIMAGVAKPHMTVLIAFSKTHVFIEADWHQQVRSCCEVLHRPRFRGGVYGVLFSSFSNFSMKDSRWRTSFHEINMRVTLWVTTIGEKHPVRRNPFTKIR